jgi:hypothetical protein
MAKTKKNIKTKAFAAFFEKIHDSYRNIKVEIQDKRLSHQEKKILQAWGFLRKNQFKSVFEILNNLDTQYDDFVEAQKTLLIGITLNNSGNSLAALGLIKKAIKDLEKFEDLGNIYFVALFNYFICSMNLSYKPEILQSLELLNSFENKNLRQTVYFKYCQFIYSMQFVQKHNFNELVKYLDKNQHEMSETIDIGYNIAKFMYFIKNEKFELGYKVLEQMKKKRSFYNQCNYIFMKSLLDNIVHDKPLYIYENDFIGNEFLFYQLMVIKSLEEANNERAEFYWSKLYQIIPHQFSKKFHYEGPSDLFKKSLEKYLNQTKHLEIGKLPSKKDEALVMLLQQSNGKLSIEQIYKLIWGSELQDKSDINKLKKLVSRVRKDKKLDIQYRKGCYIIKEAA